MRRLAALLCLLECCGCGAARQSFLSRLAVRAQDELDRAELGQALSLSARGRALAIASNDPDAEWRFRCIQAEAENSRSQWKQAERSLSGTLPASLERTPIAARVSIDRAVSQANLRNLSQAQTLLDEAARAPLTPPLMAELKLRRASLAYAKRDADGAKNLSGEALRFAREKHLAFAEANILAFQGAVMTRQRAWSDAVSLLEPASREAARAGFAGAMIKDFGNLGWCYYHLGNFDAALAATQKAESLAAQLGFPVEQRQLLSNIGTLEEDRSNFSRAFVYQSRALELARRLGEPTAIGECLHNLATNAFDRDDFRSAAQFSQEEIRTKEAIGDETAATYGRYLQGYLRLQEGHPNEAIETFQRLIPVLDGDPKLLSDSYISLAKAQIANHRPELAKKSFEDAISTIENSRATLTEDEYRITLRDAQNHCYSDYIRFLMDQNQPFAALKVAEMSRAQLLAQRLGKAGRPLPDLNRLHATAKAMDAAILSFWLAPEGSFAWIVTARDFRAVRLPSGTEIETLGEQHRKAVASSNRVSDTKLFEMLIGPVRDLIPAGGRVILVPDGGLARINFETLPVPGEARPHFWIEDVTLSSATTLSLLSAWPRRSLTGNVLLIGNAIPSTPEFPATL